MLMIDHCTYGISTVVLKTFSVHTASKNYSKLVQRHIANIYTHIYIQRTCIYRPIRMYVHVWQTEVVTTELGK